jgi:excisionase family DNA binding protein
MTAETLRNLILRRMDELDHLHDHPDPDPEIVGSRAGEIVAEVADRMARLGYGDDFAVSMELGPYLAPPRAKAYLARCLGVPPQAPPVESPYLDSQQAADYLGITVKQLRTQVEYGNLKPLRGPRNVYRFTREQLDAYVHGK